MITELPKHSIAKFQELVKNDLNIDITFEEAQEQAKDFFNLMEIIRKHNKNVG